MATDSYPVQRCIGSQCIEPQHQQTRITEAMAKAGYEGYVNRWGPRMQSFHDVFARGGLSWGEMVAFGTPGVKPHIDPSAPDEGRDTEEASRG